MLLTNKIMLPTTGRKKLKIFSFNGSYNGIELETYGNSYLENNDILEFSRSVSGKTYTNQCTITAITKESKFVNADGQIISGATTYEEAFETMSGSPFYTLYKIAATPLNTIDINSIVAKTLPRSFVLGSSATTTTEDFIDNINATRTKYKNVIALQKANNITPGVLYRIIDDEDCIISGLTSNTISKKDRFINIVFDSLSKYKPISGNLLIYNLQKKSLGWLFGCGTNRYFYTALESQAGSYIHKQFVILDDNIFPQSGTTSLGEDVSILHISNITKIDVPIANSYIPNILQEDLINDEFTTSTLNKLIPPHIDMEKVRIEPFYNTLNPIPLQKIKINLHFRDRVITENVGDDWTIDWKTQDNYFWYGTTYENKMVKWNNQYYTDAASDIIGSLGFSLDDIKYQKNKLKRSFLRILIYDSNDTLNQRLKAYSTIFMDSGKLYSLFARNVGKGYNSTTEGAMIFNVSGNTKGYNLLNSSFEITDTYDHTTSSDGFFYYIFKDNLPQKVGEEQTFYMKVEFNHAKYGQTVSFIRPMLNHEPITISSGNFPYNYIKKETPTESSPNMQQYFQDLFSKVTIKKLEDGKYGYFIEGTNGYNSSERSVTLNFYEPRINNTTDEPYFS